MPKCQIGDKDALPCQEEGSCFPRTCQRVTYSFRFHIQGVAGTLCKLHFLAAELKEKHGGGGERGSISLANGERLREQWYH